MVDCSEIVEMDVDMLTMFKCPSFQETGLDCVFVSIRNTSGLKCRDSACSIRLPVQK